MRSWCSWTLSPIRRWYDSIRSLAVAVPFSGLPRGWRDDGLDQGCSGGEVGSFERAIQTHHFSENEYLVDTWFWLARTHLKQNDKEHARQYLEKIAASDVKYDKKPQAVEMLQKIA